MNISPMTFLREVKEELDRVVWPSKEEVAEATFGIIVFCTIIAASFWVLDFVFSEALRVIIGK